MVPIALVSLRRLCGLDISGLLAQSARIALCGVVLVAVFLLAEAALPPGLFWSAAAAVAGVVAYAAVLNTLLLPGHLTRILLRARGAMPARGS